MASRLLGGPVSTLAARVELPSSKSLTNRALIAAAAAGGGRLETPLDCEDTRLLAEALDACGWAVSWGREVEVGVRKVRDNGTVHLDLGNSGTGARVLLGLLATVPGKFVVDGSKRLRERPMQPLLATLAQLGAEANSRDGHLPIELKGRRLAGGRAVLRPEVSSQFVTSLLLAAPLMERGIDLQLVGPLPSRPYIDLTEQVLQRFGASVRRSEDGRRFQVAPGGLTPTTFKVEGDWSAAAFFLAAAAVAGGTVDLGPLEPDSRQGDRALADVLQASGLRLSSSSGRIVARGPVAAPVAADLNSTPDLFPALSVVAALSPAGSVLTGLENLEHKESDRLAVMVGNLTLLGAVLEVERSSVRVLAPICRAAVTPVKVTSAGDHRVAMAMAVAALRCGPLLLDDAECVQKSFPGFWDSWRAVAP